jgi:uncharacterized protein (TIGR00266 family)
MEYKISGDILQTVDITLSEGEKVYSETGAMGWMSDNITMETKIKGGIMKGLGRIFSGESFFLVDYFVNQGSGLVSFTAEYPGKTVPFELQEGQSVICQKDSFLIAQNSVNLEVHLNQKLGSSFFGGEGFILQKFTGPGTVFASFGGEIVTYDLKEGQRLKVNPGYVAAFEPTVQFDIQTIKGLTNIFFGGEGLFLATVTGPGKVWLQTMPISQLAAKLNSLGPEGKTKGGSSTGSGFSLGAGGLNFKL